jgi:CRP-like cAMP-binding protein
MFAVNGTKKGPSGGCTVQILDGPEPEPPPGKFEYVVPQALNLSCLGINLPGGEGVAMQSPFDSPERAVEMSAQEWLAHEDDSDLEGEGKLNWSPSSMGNRDTMLSNTAKSWAACTIFGNRRRQDSTDSFNKDSPEQLTTSFDQDDLRLSVTRAPNLKDHVNMAASDRRRSSAGGSIARWFAADDTDDDGSVRSRESSGRWSLSQNSPACGLSGRTDTYCNTTPMHITPRGPLGAANEAAARLKGKFFVARALERARVSNGGMPIREGGVDDSDLRLGGCSPSAGSHGGDRGQVTPLLLNRGGVSFSADDDGSACFDDLMSSRESCVYDPLKTQSVCGDTPIKKSQFEAGQELAGPYFGFATEEYLRLPQESRDFFARDDIQDMRKSLLLMEDLHVDEIPLDQLVLLLQSAERVTFTPGEVIICHRDLAEAFYIILGPENAHAVSKRHDAVEGRQLSRGNYFGELGLIRDPGCPYAETVLAETSVEAIRVQSSSFHLWGRFHMHLLLKQVSLLAKLPLSAQMAIHSRLQFADFAPNSYIVRQGEMGDKFFMIMKGSAEVKDTVASPDGSTAERFITNLHEGHSFGELALIYDEPRSASVVAIGNVSCTYLTKDDFRACLSDSKVRIFAWFISFEYFVFQLTRRFCKFAEMMEENAHKIAVYREERARRRNPIRFCSPAKRFSTGSLAAAPSPSLSIRKRKSFRKVTSVSYRRSIVEGDEVSSGGGSGKKGSTSMVINNKYEIIKEIGKGSYGSVYSCRELSTGNMYAMKVIDTGKKGMKRKQMRDSLRREVAAMKKLRHPNIVTLWEVIDDPKVSTSKLASV